MSITSVSDVATELGRPILTDGAEWKQVEAWIGRVEARIAKRIPDLLDRVTDDGHYGLTLVGVVAAVVARKIRNPEGLKSERIDDYYYDRNSQPADLTLTDAEWAELLPMSQSGAFTMRARYVPDAGC